MESGLRWILILISIVILALIMFDGWRRINRQKNGRTKPLHPEKNHVNHEYELEEEQQQEECAVIIKPKPAVEEAIPKKISTSSTHPAIFVLNILPENGKVFTGAHLLPTLLTLGMRHGDLSIFHRHEQISGNGNVLFSLASATEPGIFHLDAMESQEFHGLTLFLQVPGPAHPNNALNLMLQTGKRLAQILGGKLYDDKRQHLSESALERQYQLRLRQVLGRT